MSLYKKPEQFHFRHHKYNGHNALIVGEDNQNYDFIKITHSPKMDKKHKNLKFKQNPRKSNKEDSYYENKIRNNPKDNFYGVLKNWRLSKSDSKSILELLKRKRKK